MLEISSEVKDLRKQAKQAENERETFDRRIEDLNDQLEMMMLDKEVAEEKFEQAEAKLEASKERVAELQVELEMLKQEEG